MNSRCFVLLFALLTLSSGCGSDGNKPGVELKGSVTLDGTPLSTGAITFIPINQGTSVGATITEGAYLIPAAQGAQAGEYRVEIDSSQPTGKQIQSAIGDSLEAEFINVIPEQFNRNSTLKVIVKPEGDHIHDFEIKSKP